MATKFAAKFFHIICSYSRNSVLSSQTPLQVVNSSLLQTRSYHPDWRMYRDVKRRAMCKEYASQRDRLNCIRKNKILPKVIREFADQEIAALPRDSAFHRTKSRCVVTSRARGVLARWRLSRFVFRYLCDHNQMSGVQRAMW